MCGIAGVIAADPALPIDEGPLLEAAKLLSHRGPDGFNVWAEPGVGFSHTRLAIIDRAHGDQPMFSQDGRYAVVFNGEIYNHHDLRRELESHGYCLTTRCDTEVLLYLYDWLGPAMVDRLRGMFAFVVFDRRERRALLARDRFGKKPLYFSEVGGVLRFASTLDALRCLLPARPDVDVAAIVQYLVLQYVPSPLTPYRSVRKLSPGHSATWSEGAVDARPYWEPTPRAVGAGTTGRREAAARVRELIGEAVRIRLESEVPLGVFLSGGLDSSIIVAEMVSAGMQPKTYSVGFRHASFDETRFARLVADRFGTDHHELVADLDVEATFRDLVAFYDEPFADSSALATLAVARAAAEHVTVILTGDGGDEMFGGYERYLLYERARRVNRLLGPLAGVGGRTLELIGAAAHRSRASTAGRFARDPWAGYRDALFHFRPDELPALLRSELHGSMELDAPVGRLDWLWQLHAPGVSALPWIDQQTYLPDDLLTKMDRATMAHSLEARSPLLDHVLAEACAALPESFLFDDRGGKSILRSAYAEVLPTDILTRPKMGFGVPIAAWMRGELRSQLQRLLLSADGPLWAWLRRETVVPLAERFLAGDAAQTRRVWNLLALAAWADARVTNGKSHR
jgi:asparagine synthase (glutamine-hydrolysing)